MTLRVLSSAMGGNIEISEFLRPICKKLGMDFVTMSEWKVHDILWKKETWLSHLEHADIVVCVARHEEQPAKSANRAVQAMAFGKPVLASPLPAYLEVIKHGENGFICRSQGDWEKALEQLLYEGMRKKIGANARADAQAFSIEEVGCQWSSFLKNQARENCNPPQVDIIIPTLDNLEYLKPCIESIRKATDWPHKIIVVCSGTKPETIDWIKRQPDIEACFSPDRLHFSKANNWGLKLSNAPYVCLLNDDTIVGHGWLNALMHEAQKPGMGAVGPFSNCDRGWLHDEVITAGGFTLVPAMKMEDLADAIPKIQEYRHRKEVVERKWVAFYCTLIPREVIRKIGLLDEGFLSGDEDVDYCKRISEAGYRIVQTFDSWVFHFGGKTRKKADEADHDRHQREDLENHTYFIKKWGVSPADPSLRNSMVASSILPAPPKVSPQKKEDRRPVFCLYTGEAWERWSPLSLEEGGIGGSETATVYTARDFQKLGFRSIVIGDCQGREGNYDGVEYVHHSKLDEILRMTEFELFVSSRRVDVFQKDIHAKKKACVIHDIWLSQDKNANLWPDRVDAYFVLSPWHRNFFLKHHAGAPEAKVKVSRDGVDLKRFEKPGRRDPGRIVYSSSPDRGLDTLLSCLPKIRKRIPHANVHVFYGFENWEKAIRQRGTPDELRWMDSIKGLLEDPGVVMRGRVGQTQLAREMMRAQVWAHPTRFTETFCITACEQMAAGNPAVTTDLGALATTVGDGGLFISGDAYEKSYQDAFVEVVVELMMDGVYWKKYHEKALKQAKKWSWDGIAKEWLDLVGLPVPEKK